MGWSTGVIVVSVLLLEFGCKSASRRDVTPAPVSAAARSMGGSPMETAADLAAFIDLALQPSFDVAAAEARLGPIDRWIGGHADVKETDPALRESAIEALNGQYVGLHANLKQPFAVPWKDLTEALGPPEERIYEVDNSSGRVTLCFKRLVGDRHGVVYLYAKRNEDPARIESIMVRRTAQPKC